VVPRCDPADARAMLPGEPPKAVAGWARIRSRLPNTVAVLNKRARLLSVS